MGLSYWGLISGMDHTYGIPNDRLTSLTLASVNEFMCRSVGQSVVISMVSEVDESRSGRLNLDLAHTSTTQNSQLIYIYIWIIHYNCFFLCGQLFFLSYPYINILF